jgi:hypothetical protein
MARSTFYTLRVSALLAVLVLVLVYAWHDFSARRERAAWNKPLQVAVVLVRLGNRDATSLAAVARFRQRVAVLEERLHDELGRYRTAPERMLRFDVYGPVNAEVAPPQLECDSLWCSAQHTFALWRYTRAVDAAAGLPTRAFDSRIYAVLEPVTSERKFVEGFSEQGGRVGVARVQLDESTVDLGLFVLAHELMHTLGASDKYDAEGAALIPFGLGDSEQTPLYPQLRAEVMARNRVLAPGQEAVPDSLSELSVGSWTAREIGWLVP